METKFLVQGFKLRTAGEVKPARVLLEQVGTEPVDGADKHLRETDDFADYLVLVVPSAFELSDDAWARLTAFVQGGGTVLLSYGGGDAHPAIRDLFGVEFLGDGGPRSEFSCRVAQDDVLGALVSAGLPWAELVNGLKRLKLSGYRLRKRDVHRGTLPAMLMRDY